MHTTLRVRLTCFKKTYFVFVAIDKKENMSLLQNVIFKLQLVFGQSCNLLLQNLDAPSAVYSYSGTVASTNLNVRMGGFVSCISGALSKYLDIDYIGNYFNSAH